MKKIRVLYICIAILMIGVVIIYLPKDKNELSVSYEQPKSKSYSSAISMMYETEAGSGEYVESKESTWPQDGYTFNSTLSKCENGSTLSWDDTNKKIMMSGNTSDKCYVYFDKVLTLAEYVIGQYTAQGTNGLYLHDSTLENSAEDGSYRYAGANPSNYVCFGTDEATCDSDHLYRIIGVFGNQVKLIKADFATAAQLGTTEKGRDWNKSSYPNYKGSLTTIPVYYWSGSRSNQVNSWASSSLNTNALNKNYANSLGTTWMSKIATTSWKVGGNTWANIGTQNAKTAYTNEITNPVTGQTAVTNKIGLMYVSDYMYGASPTYWTYKGNDTETTDYRAAINANWMYSGLYEWTISRRSDDTYDAFIVNLTGNVNNDFVYNYLGVRPSFYLESSVKLIDGEGTSSKPFIIS